MDAVDEAEARVPRPMHEFFFAHKPVMPIPERPDADMGPEAREHPIERIIGQREARTRASKDDMTAGSHNPREFPEAGARVDDVFDHLEAAHNIETRIIEWHLLGVGDEIFYPRYVRVESTGMRNVPLVQVARDKITRGLAKVAIDIPFAATDVDHAPDLGGASDTIQCPQHPAVAGAVGWQEKLVVQPTAHLNHGNLHAST